MDDPILIPAQVTANAANVWLGFQGESPAQPTVVHVASGSKTHDEIQVSSDEGSGEWRRAVEDDRYMVREVSLSGLRPSKRYKVEWRANDESLLAETTFSTLPLDLPSSWPVAPTTTLHRFRGNWVPR